MDLVSTMVNAREQAKEDHLTPKDKRRSLLRLLGRFFTPYLGWFVLGTIAAIATAAFAASYAEILRQVGNGIQEMTVTQGSNAEWIWPIVLIIIGLSIGRAISQYSMAVWNNTGVQKALVSIQSAQFDSLMRGDFARMAQSDSGGYVSRFINDTNAIRDAALRFANNFTKSIVTVVVLIGYMFWLDWQLTCLLVIIYPIAFRPVFWIGERIRERARNAQTQIGEVTSFLSEGFQLARIVKAYGLEEYQEERAEKGFTARSKLFLKVLRDRSKVDPILEIAGGVALAGILAATAWRMAAGDSSLGNLLAIIGAIAIIAPEIRALGSINSVAQEGRAAADRVFEILDTVTQVNDQIEATTLENVEGRLEFKSVSFFYSDRVPALNNLSFDVAPGQTVALVGRSGSGKSTIFNLILRLYDAVEGDVFIDGTDIRKLSSRSLRDSLALVSQDAVLFDDSVRSNIKLGRLSASDDEIIKVAKAAQAHDFIMELPEGYDTACGEMGKNLSGGQRQRISLARAILRDAPILLLDEATSAIDTENEAKIQEVLSSLCRARTTLVISHRMSTIRNADKILVVDSGQVVEEGDHQTLMREKGVYSRLVEMQFAESGNS